LRELRSAIIEESAEEFCKQWFVNYFRDEKEGVPLWIKNALKHCEIEI